MKLVLKQIKLYLSIGFGQDKFNSIRFFGKLDILKALPISDLVFGIAPFLTEAQGE